MKKITIKEIAERAGVSAGTVDRVLHNRGDVAKKTRELVVRIAREGNYSTNVYARNLKLNKSYRLAIVIPNDNEYWRMQAAGIEQMGNEYLPLGIQIHHFSFDRRVQGSFQAQCKAALTFSPDGVVLAPLFEQEAQTLCLDFTRQNIPFVLVDSNLAEVNPLSFIGQDSKRSGYLAAKLLNYGFPEGHETLIIRYSAFDSLNKTIQERIAGFREYYGDHKLNADLLHEITLDDLTELSNTLKSVSSSGPVHLFVPNSRAHDVVDALDRSIQTRIVGYDLVGQNLSYLKENRIDFIIDQNPTLQGRLSIRSFHTHFVLGEEVAAEQKMALQICTKENV